MAGMSTYLQNALINETLRNTNYVPVTPLYLALYTASPTVADVGTELSTGSYARQAITFINPVLGATSNAALITFPTSTAIWGTITHFAIRDALTVGNLLYFGAFTTPRTLALGDTITCPIGNLDITLT